MSEIQQAAQAILARHVMVGANEDDMDYYASIIVTAKEAAAALGISVGTLAVWRQRGVLQPVDIERGDGWRPRYLWNLLEIAERIVQTPDCYFARAQRSMGIEPIA